MKCTFQWTNDLRFDFFVINVRESVACVSCRAASSPSFDLFFTWWDQNSFFQASCKAPLDLRDLATQCCNGVQWAGANKHFGQPGWTWIHPLQPTNGEGLLFGLLGIHRCDPGWQIEYHLKLCSWSQSTRESNFQPTVCFPFPEVPRRNFKNWLHCPPNLPKDKRDSVQSDGFRVKQWMSKSLKKALTYDSVKGADLLKSGGSERYAISRETGCGALRNVHTRGSQHHYVNPGLQGFWFHINPSSKPSRFIIMCDRVSLNEASRAVSIILLNIEL